MNYHTGTCKEVIKRIEKDVVTPDENCYMKKADMCGPINCKVKNFSPSHVSIDLIHNKFVNITTVCNVKNSTVMVDLRERECTVCQPSLRERLEVLDVCDDVLTQDCQDDPLLRPWTKFCDTNISQILNTGLTFKFEKSLPNRLVMDLVEQSLVPINDLLSDTLRLEPNNEQDSTEIIPKLSTPGQLRPQETTEDVSEILNLLAQQQIEARGSDVFPGEVVLPSPAPRPPLFILIPSSTLGLCLKIIFKTQRHPLLRNSLIFNFRNHFRSQQHQVKTLQMTQRIRILLE